MLSDGSNVVDSDKEKEYYIPIQIKTKKVPNRKEKQHLSSLKEKSKKIPVQFTDTTPEIIGHSFKIKVLNLTPFIC